MKTATRFRLLFILTISIFLVRTAIADIAVIVHKTNTTQISNQYIANIFMSKIETFENGEQAIPINQVDNKVRQQFNRSVLQRNRTQLRAYWSKMLFTGNARIPKTVLSDQAVIDLIKNNKRLIGYIDSKAVTDEVRVIAYIN